jgi:hypothetical protein
LNPVAISSKAKKRDKKWNAFHFSQLKKWIAFPFYSFLSCNTIQEFFFSRDVIPTFNSKGFPENKVTSKLIARKFERKNSIS